MDDIKHKDEDYWKQKLTPEQYHVLREKGTEPPFSGRLLENAATGMYVCAACGQELFSSAAKYESGSGWPSFYSPLSGGEHINESAEADSSESKPAQVSRGERDQAYEAVDEERIELAYDESHGLERVEVTCSRCGSHLGHVFDDGPEPTGKRYCINSLSLDFKKKE